jgi:hypothetical protein
MSYQEDIFEMHMVEFEQMLAIARTTMEEQEMVNPPVCYSSSATVEALLAHDGHR